ncbi:hypothetical protein EON79_07600 [bacterium]|nr:MAG: hypothetical protein EON79_07600 [bacterium]
MIGLVCGVALLGQVELKGNPPRNPALHRTWVAVAVPQGTPKPKLTLEPSMRFTMVSTGPKKADNFRITGLYKLEKADEAVKALYKSGSYVYLYTDLANAKKLGMPAAEVARLKKEGKKWQLMTRFVFDPTIPILTDVMTTNFAPVGGEAEAMRRYNERMQEFRGQ